MVATSDYTSPSSLVGNLLTISLGAVETSATRQSAGISVAALPPLSVDTGRADIDGTTFPAGVSKVGQRASVATRGAAVILAGRAGAAASHAMHSSSFFDLGLDAIEANLAANALAVNLGMDLRYLGDPTKLGAPISTFYPWTPSVPASSSLPISINTAGTGTAPVVNGGASYVCRTGDIIRPTVELEGCYTTFDPGHSGLTEGTYPTFTLALVAMIHEGPWSFNDLLTVSSNAVNPLKAIAGTLRYERDDISLYVGNVRHAIHKVVTRVAAPGSRPRTRHVRPVIIVWAMDRAGSASLVIITAHDRFIDTVHFKRQPVFSGPFVIAAGGNSFLDPDRGLFNTGFQGMLGRMEIMDFAYDSSAFSLENCEAVARSLDHVYGVAR